MEDAVVVDAEEGEGEVRKVRVRLSERKDGGEKMAEEEVELVRVTAKAEGGIV